jgi:hypothetical protein
MREAGKADSGWLFGSGVDLAIGCGVGSMALMAAMAAFGQRTIEAWVPGAMIILVFALPHYGATLVRVYEDREDRARYRLFSVWATLAVASAFLASLYNHYFGSLLLTVYLTWSPWHYTGQNYGVSLMLAARHGVAIDPRGKRFVYASFVTSFLLTVFAIHSGQPEGSYAPVSYGGTVFELVPIGIPHAIASVCIAVLGAVYLVTTALAVRFLVRSAGLRAAAPTLALMLTQALWFALPVPIRHWELAGPDSLLRHVYTPYGFLWIAGYHSLQYLWITTYYATESSSAVRAQPNPWARRAAFLGKSALLGYAVWTVPALVFAPNLLGGLPHESGLAVMVAAVVNLHHFILDGAVWKLRDGRVARILLRGAPAGSDGGGEVVAERAGRGVPWLRRTLQAVGAACLMYSAFLFWSGDFGFSKSMVRGDVEGARQAVERLADWGRDGPGRRTELGRRLAREGDTVGARSQLERGVSLNPTARGLQSLGRGEEPAGAWPTAASADESARGLDPDDPVLLFRAGRAWLESGHGDRAVPLLERAAHLAPGDRRVAPLLARARQEAPKPKRP